MDKNPFGNGMGGDGAGANGGTMSNGGNDFTKNPNPQSPPAQGGNDFTKNPGGFNGGTVKPSPQGPDPSSIPSGGRMPFSPKPSGAGAKPTVPFKLKG